MTTVGVLIVTWAALVLARMDHASAIYPLQIEDYKLHI